MNGRMGRRGKRNGKSVGNVGVKEKKMPAGADAGRNGELVSIIVPVYQVEEYLERCVGSLMAQTYGELEIILIDDGSTDGSGRLCDEYAKKDGRIKVIHQKNAGLAGARNTGLESAKGEYMAFVDSDDMVSPVFVETLYTAIKKYNAEIAVGSYERSEGDAIREKKWVRDYCLSSERMLKEWHGKRKKLETVVWNKLYHKSVFGDERKRIAFPEGKIHEDVYVSHLFIRNAKRIAVTNQRIYLYRMRKGSIKKSVITEQSARQSLEAQQARMEFFKNQGMMGSYVRNAAGYWLHVLMYMWKLGNRKIR